jgi:hypothetical protein
LLRAADWDVDGVRDDRGYSLERLADEASGVFIVDETGFIKKGVRSAGVQRQYTGTTGKIDTVSSGCFGLLQQPGPALTDRELYLAPSWTQQPDRCARAGIPVAGHRRQAKVLATLAGTVDDKRDRGGWERRSIGPGAHGERTYDWTVVELDRGVLPQDWSHWLLVRRQIEPAPDKRNKELAFYRCAGDPDTSTRADPGRRRPLSDRGMLPDHEERSRPRPVPGPLLASLVRAHITLAMLAAAYLAATRAHEAEKGDPKRTTTG